jgi:Reverse transcriptase (RNA-dependent DNA polymerase)
MVVCFVDDLGVSGKTQGIIDDFVGKLRSRGFELDIEGSFEQYLGIIFERNVRDGTIEMTQKGLITKIITMMGLDDCKPNLTPASQPASQPALGKDENGEPIKESWNYPSIIGMLLYLSTNTRPDISLAISQVGQFRSSPRQSHTTAVETIVRYLVGTINNGMILKPRGDLKLEMFCDADFSGL